MNIKKLNYKHQFQKSNSKISYFKKTKIYYFINFQINFHFHLFQQASALKKNTSIIHLYSLSQLNYRILHNNLALKTASLNFFWQKTHNHLLLPIKIKIKAKLDLPDALGKSSRDCGFLEIPSQSLPQRHKKHLFHFPPSSKLRILGHSIANHTKDPNLEHQLVLLLSLSDPCHLDRVKGLHACRRFCHLYRHR